MVASSELLHKQSKRCFNIAFVPCCSSYSLRNLSGFSGEGTAQSSKLAPWTVVCICYSELSLIRNVLFQLILHCSVLKWLQLKRKEKPYNRQWNWYTLCIEQLLLVSVPTLAFTVCCSYIQKHLEFFLVFQQSSMFISFTLTAIWYFIVFQQIFKLVHQFHSLLICPVRDQLFIAKGMILIDQT